MSFRYCGQFVSLDNYKHFFEECTPDILDEIRSAVMDDTDISPYIDACGDDSYLLGQIRIALREHIPSEFLDARLTGKTIYNIRKCFDNGRSAADLLWYITPKALKVEKDVIELLSKFVLLGTNISRVDFTLVPKQLVPVFLKGLYKGFPMWILVDDSSKLDIKSVQILMRGMELGIDIQPFSSGQWGRDAMLLLFSYAKACDINMILSYINNKFNIHQIKVLLDLASAGVPIQRLCVKDSSGAPVYTNFQMYELGESLRNGVDIGAMFSPKLSDFEMAKMREAALSERAAQTN